MFTLCLRWSPIARVRVVTGGGSDLPLDLKIWKIGEKKKYLCVLKSIIYFHFFNMCFIQLRFCLNPFFRFAQVVVI